MSLDKAKKVLVLYSTIDGQTKKIAEYLEGALESTGLVVVVKSINESITLGDYDLAVLGASIRYGKHNEKFIDFVNDNQLMLSQIKTAFYSVNLVARKENKQTKETNPYVKKFFDKVEWAPELVGIFAGCLDYSRYGFLDTLMIKLIMKMTKGPTKSKEPIEFTNWNKVDAFAKELVYLAKK